MDIKVLVPLAHGSEEMEAVIIIDILRRAGITVKVAGENDIITCSRGVKILSDLLIEDVEQEDEFDAIIIPGGANGTQRLIENEHLRKIIASHHSKNKLIGAICAAPTLLAEHKLISYDSMITSHPSVKVQLENFHYKEDIVVEDGNFITSRGAGTAFDFAFAIINRLINREMALKISNDIVYNVL